MLVEAMAAVTANIAVAMVGTVADMPRPPMLRADIMSMVFAAGVATRAMQGAHITRLAAVIGEAGEVTTAIGMAIPAIVQAITDWAIATRTTAITVTAPVGTMIHITDTILTDTGTGLT
jgi:hypothetical protein